MAAFHNLKAQPIPIAKLIPHPLQAAFYDDCDPADDDVLRRDLAEHGQRDPIVVMPPGNAAGLPDFTILDGHRRARLLAELGVTTVKIIVRHDLKDADAATVEAEFLRFNFSRRQLHPLNQARVALRLMEIEKKRSATRLRSSHGVELRDRIGAIIGMSGRNLNRYLRVLETPLEVQRLVRDNRLKLVDGAAIAYLPAERQQAVVQALSKIGAGDDASAIVRPFLPKVQRRPKKPAAAMQALVSSLALAVEAFGDQFDTVNPLAIVPHRPALKTVRAVIRTLINRSEPEQVAAARQSHELELRRRAADMKFLDKSVAINVRPAPRQPAPDTMSGMH